MKPGIVICKSCGAKNRICPHSAGLRPVCGRCSSPLTQSASHPAAELAPQGVGLQAAISLLLLFLLAGTIYGISVAPALLKGDFSRLAQEEETITQNLRMQHAEQLDAHRLKLDAEIATIDAENLRRSAATHYKNELEGRKSFDKRFALTPREKAQLHMQSLASDSTRSFHDAIRAVAREASPPGSDIHIRESSGGIALLVDFDMSSMTSGEHGTRTKHHTKDSLRKEVVSLISRVTNDIFQFCKDLNVRSIHIGCRHYVKTRYPSGGTREENTVLYRVRIKKSRVEKLTSNPFLDVYSTTRHFEVDEDNFDDIEIITTQI
jgi:hypothetical protein